MGVGVWSVPPRVKVFEALGSIADGRVKIVQRVSGHGDGVLEAQVYSSSRGKFYTVKFDKAIMAIMTNDNPSYWVGYLGYPAIAVLMLEGVLPLNSSISNAFKGIAWKDVNQKHKNDWSKTEDFVIEIAKKQGFSREELISEGDKVIAEIKKLGFKHLGAKTKPPEGY